MARIRTIKPDFFRHEALQDLETANPGAHVMLVFAGLWGHCDKGGAFLWKPRSLKLDILPFLDFDLGASLMLLWEARLIERYENGGQQYGFVPTFCDHQRLSGKEVQEPSKYPQHNGNFTNRSQGSAGEASGKHPDAQEGKGREEEGKKGSEAKASAAPAAHVVSVVRSSEAEVYRAGKEVLGRNAGGMITDLRKSQKFDDRAALDLIEQARAKNDPREWLGAVLRGDAEAATPEHVLYPPDIYRNVL